MDIRYPVARPSFSDNEMRYVSECVRSSWVSSQGPFLERFENEMAQLTGAQFGVATSSGTTALHLLLAALGVGGGDEVIVPTLTFVATVNAIRYCGAIPIFVDSSWDGPSLDVTRVANLVGPRTRAILAVHLYGEPADHERLHEIASRHDLALVYDSAEALGTLYHGQPIGGLGVASVYSFFGNKVLTTGEGGLVVTNDIALRDRLRFLRGQGQDPRKRYWFTEVGFNYRMTNLQAGLGLGQLERLPNALSARSEIAQTYKRVLRNVPEVTFIAPVDPGNESPWLVTISVTGLSRDLLAQRLLEDGIETRPVFYPVHTLPPYLTKGDFINAERFASTGISLPTYDTLHVEEAEWIGLRVRHHIATLAQTQA